MAIRIYGNRAIKTLPGELTRPTSARVREALFNVWQGRVSGCRWLDLCAGSGAIGAEALCRGATEVIGIEKSAAACRVIKENWQKVATAEQRFEIVRSDVAKLSARLPMQLASNSEATNHSLAFDLIYFDPPYAIGLYKPVLAQLADYLAPSGEAAIEYGQKHWQPSELPETLELIKEKRYGSTCVAFVRRSIR